MRQNRNRRQLNTRKYVQQPQRQEASQSLDAGQTRSLSFFKNFSIQTGGGFWIRGKWISYMSICAAALFISLLVLLLACFSAATYYSAEQKLEQAQTAESRSQEYYAAESTASEIISAFYQERRETSANLNGRSVYTSDQGDIEVTKIDNVIYFSVPAGSGQLLNVEAKASKKQVVIQKWQLEKE